MKNVLKRCIARVLIVCMLGMGLPLSASAGMVTADQVNALQSSTGSERDRVRSFLDRADVQARIQALGVDPASARARADALSDDEARNLAARIDRLPAGGDGIIGALLLVFLVLLLTDILGVTKVFPFTRSAR